LEEARRLLEEARNEGARLGDPAALVEVENGFGQLFLAAGDPRGAELHFRAALRHATSPRARVAIGVNLGEALLEQGRTLEAAERAREAEAEALAGSVTGKLPEVYRLLARVGRDRAETEAFVFLEQALELIRERGLPSYEEALTREAYGNLRISEGDLDRGLPQLREASALFESIGMDERAATLLEAVSERGGSS
jgi:tetratricopeptide (TPR) repeat protein